jgi:hypothetical protein
MLHELLKAVTDDVYFQPPENIKIEYPCIVYTQDLGQTYHADNRPYWFAKRYQVTVIDRNPDSTLPDQVAEFPTCSMTQSYMVDGLHHWVYTLFF